MAYNDELANIRKSILQLLNVGVLNPEFKDLYETTLIQILNDSEKNRQLCLQQAENLKRQAAVLEGQSSGFASMASIISAILNGFISAADRASKEVMHNRQQD